ncbi:MAG TPA: hypothetical protein VF808_01550 [Ktedonobacterales bacterium]
MERLNGHIGRRAGAGLALAATLAFTACATATGGGYGAYGAPPASGSGSTVPVNLTCASGAAVCTKQVALGGQSKTVLANTSGMTLYYFMADTAKSSACTGACAQTWPPLIASGSVVGAGLVGTLATLSDANGQQVTYNGHPLYTYSGDHAQTDAIGNGIGGKWYVAYPALTPASSGHGGGYGY